MGFVFISYSRQDTKTVDQIVSWLERDGFEVWIDRANIKGGDLWTVAIVEAIDTADSFLLMLSPSATASDNVRKEVQLAQDANRRLFPLVIMAVKLPAQFRYQLAGIQMIDYAADPQAKYRELVEVLGVQRQRLAGVKPPETRQVELVLPAEKVSGFNAPKQRKLLHFLAQLSQVAPSKLTIVKIKAGSVHAIVDMPTQAAYVLKTAALNRDPRLLDHGIVALRLDGEENYVWVKSGEIGPFLAPKPRPSFFRRLLSWLIGLGLIAALLYAVFPGFRSVVPPPFQEVPITSTPSRKPPTKTPVTKIPAQITTRPPSIVVSDITVTPSPTSPPIITITVPPPIVPNAPPSMLSIYTDPPPPIACGGFASLGWDAYDPDGTISRYRVIFFVDDTGPLQSEEIPNTKRDITDIVSKYCATTISVQISAQDNNDEWGPPMEFKFYVEPPAPS